MPNSKAREEKSAYEKELDAFLRNLAKVYPLDKAEAKAVRAFLKSRGNVSKAASAAGISRKTFYNWLEKPHFLEACEEAEEWLCDQAEETLVGAAHTDWKAALAFLERRRPDPYNGSLVRHRGMEQPPPGDDVPHTVTYERGEEPEHLRKKRRKNGSEDA